MKQITIGVTTLFILLSSSLVLAGSKGNIREVSQFRIKDGFQPKVLGLFIGIKEYQDPLWHDLRYPKKDVADMVRFFSKKSPLKLDYRMVLTKPKNTTRDYILNKSLDRFAMRNLSENDVVIVYISSHGSLSMEQVTVINAKGEKQIENRKKPYILTSDTREERMTDSAIPLSRMTDWFERLPSRRKVLILDMCHSGRNGKSQISAAEKEKLSREKGIGYVPMEDSRASIILAACPIGGTSFEDSQIKNSVYTHFLLKGMTHGDLNKDGGTTISEAHNYAIDRTMRYTWKKFHYKQIPTSYSRVLGKEPIIVSGAPKQPGLPSIASYSSGNQGLSLFVDGLFKGMLPKGVAVSPGVHKIECRNNGERLFSDTRNFKTGFDYMLPEVNEKKEPPLRKKVFISPELIYQQYSQNALPDDAVPDTAAAGISVRFDNFGPDWLSLSAGFDMSGNSDVDIQSFRAGLYYIAGSSKNRLYIGPEIMRRDYLYKKTDFGDVTIDSEYSLLCPGLGIEYLKPIGKRYLLNMGARFYYIPYEVNSTVETVISNQFFMGLGFFWN